MISAYAHGLELAGAATPAAHLQTLAELLREFPNRTMADLVECDPNTLPECEAASGSFGDGPTVVEVIPHLEALEHILESGRARAAQTADLGLLIDLLRRGNSGEYDSRYLSPMLNVLRQALAPRKSDKQIGEFIDRLRAETGSERFEKVLSELANSRLTKQDIIEVATAVYGRIPKKTSRKAALNFIRKPHDAYMSAKRGIDATGGRSAA
jgi:hypothetical protein